MFKKRTHQIVFIHRINLEYSREESTVMVAKVDFKNRNILIKEEPQTACQQIFIDFISLKLYSLSALSLITDTWNGVIISWIFGSELVKIEGACLSLSQVSGATHTTAADTAGVCSGDDAEESRR